MPCDVGKNYCAGPALQRVHPIALPGIADDVSFTAIPDVETVEPMESNRQPDAEGFEHNHQRQTAHEPYLAGIGLGTIDGHGVGKQNRFEQTCADRDNSTQRMQAPPEVGASLASPQRGNSSVDFGNEAFGIWLPITFHGLYGFYIWYRGETNVISYPWQGNWMYTLQRWTGAIIFAYIAWHVWHLRFTGVDLHQTPGASFGKVQLALPQPALLSFYLVLLLSAPS